MKAFLVSVLVCLGLTAPAWAQPNDEDKKMDPALIRAGNELMEQMPEVPRDTDIKAFYELSSNSGGIGWHYYELDSVEYRGKLHYRYRSEYAFDGIEIGWYEGKSEYILRNDFSPVRCDDDFLSITPELGMNNIEQTAVFVDGEMKSRRLLRGNVEDVTHHVPGDSAAMLLEPLFDKLELEDKQKFILGYYDPRLNDFGSIEYEALRRDGNEFRLSTKQWYVIIDQTPGQQAQPNETVKRREGYIIIDGKGSIKKREDLVTGITWIRTDKERVVEIRKKMYELLQDDE